MKCPKCGYLGFETVDRCRNCGYDFSLTPDSSDAELPLREGKETSNPLSDLEIAGSAADAPSSDPTLNIGKSSLDLDRLIGAPADAPLERSEPTLDRSRSLPSFEEGTPLLDAVERAAQGAATSTATPNLPLFGGEPSERVERAARRQEEPAFVTPPRPAGPPLAVRRATPEVTRPKNRAPRTARPDEPPLSFPVDVSIAPRSGGGPFGSATDVVTSVQVASSVARLAAAIIDVVLLVGICSAVLYLTMRLADLPLDRYRVLPIVPMAAFLILIVLGYLIAFTAAGGQTIGKMAARIRVVSDDGGPVDVSGAVLRVAGTAVNIATLGLAWVPALFSQDGRSVADRLAHTRVVRA